MYIKPVSDYLVPDPDLGDTLPAEGRLVEATQYWLRRLLQGDVQQVDPPSILANQAVVTDLTNKD